MKPFLILSITVFLLASCYPEQEVTYWEKIRLGTRDLDTMRVQVSADTLRDTASYTYTTKFDTFTFLSPLQHKENAKLKYGAHKKAPFKLVEDTTLTVNRKAYRVYHYSTADLAMDSGVEYYWNDQVGMFFIRGKEWPNYSILQSTNSEKNKLIKLLVEGVYPKMLEVSQQMNDLEKSGIVRRR